MSCGSEPSQPEVPVVSRDTIERPFDSMDVPPPDPRVQPLIDEKAKKSIFSSVGCCFDGKQISSDACCCQLVLEKYEEVIRKEDKKAISEFDTDPILGKCRKKMRAAFDSVDSQYDDDGIDY